jgi:hypothetical protein
VKAAIHRNHGLPTAGRHGIESAAFWFIALERCCRQQLMIEAAGRPPVLVPPERARYSREHVGSDYIGWPTSSRSTTGCCRPTPICSTSTQNHRGETRTKQ